MSSRLAKTHKEKWTNEFGLVEKAMCTYMMEKIYQMKVIYPFRAGVIRRLAIEFRENLVTKKFNNRINSVSDSQINSKFDCER